MTPKDFKTLSNHEQETLIFNEGNFLDSIIEDDHIFALYSIESFLVELEYDMTNYCISSKNIFNSDRKLEKYKFQKS